MYIRYLPTGYIIKTYILQCTNINISITIIKFMKCKDTNKNWIHKILIYCLNFILHCYIPKLTLFMEFLQHDSPPCFKSMKVLILLRELKSTPGGITITASGSKLDSSATSKMFMTFHIKHLCMAIYFTSNSSKFSLRNNTAFLIFSAIPDPFICSVYPFGLKIRFWFISSSCNISV